MFDRIAKVYDLLNTVMTAGLHHRWRERAVDFALVGPGSRVLLMRRPRTGDLAIEVLPHGVWPPAGRWWAATSPRRCSHGRAPSPSPRAPS